MSGDVHVRICEHLGGRFPGVTRLIVTGHSKEWLEKEVMPVLGTFLSKRGLTLSPEKTRITHITDGFDFLGWNSRKYNGKLLIKPSKANIKSHLNKVREVIKGHKTIEQSVLIRILNPILRGWANYHRHVVAKKTFANNDAQIWTMLRKWARRKHPNKGARWVKERYYITLGNRNGVFAAKEDKKHDRKVVLFSEASTPIRRHVKIKGEANPHSPAWRTYFDARRERIAKLTPLYYRVPQGAFVEA